MRVDGEALAKGMHSQLSRLGVAGPSADHAVGSMIETSLRGVDSHGVNLFPHYCRAVSAGRINPQPEMRLELPASGIALLDADHAFGHHAGTVGMSAAITAARANGVGLASVSHSTHFGAAAYFALPAARSGFLGLAFTNADALVKAFGGSVATFGTNPICFCAPMADEQPLCLDMATSTISWNRVRNALGAGESLPSGVAHDEDGNPTTDPAMARMLEPIGGYKGYGLGFMIDILCGVLAGGPVGREILPMFSAPIEARRSISHFFMAIDIRAFMSLSDFEERIAGLARGLRALSREGAPVMAPGDPEKAAYLDRSKRGIPMTDAVWAEFLAIDGALEACRID